MDNIHHHHHAHAHHQHSKRENGLRSNLLPSRTTIIQKSRVLAARAACTNDTDDGCRKPTQTPTAVIIVAIVVPVVVMMVVLLYLHRRNGKKLREEDAKGNYGSDDFGMQGGGRKAQMGRTGPEMSSAGTEKPVHGRGMSTDVMSPYILPPGLHGSRESFHSLSRSMNDPHDPYRQVVFGKGDGGSIHSESRHDNGSVYTTSSGGTDKHAMNNSLLKNAQTMPQSQPPRGESKNVTDANAIPLSPLNPFHGAGSFPGPPPPAPASPPPASNRGGAEEMPSTFAAFKPMDPPTFTAPLPRIQSQAAVVHEKRDTSSYLSNSSYGDAFQVTPPSPHNSHIPQAANKDPLAPQPLRPHNDTPGVGLGVDTPGFNPNRLSMSVRPLPPDDPSENQEERANRIRSFYKEYFDDSKPEPVGGHVYNEYYEDYGSEYLDGAIFDSQSGAFVVAQPQAPHAAPVTRRAMTPPPRAPPRFRSNTGGGGPPRNNHMSGQSSVASSSRFAPPRNMSSMSGRAPPSKKPLPAPTPLASLPTPAKLTENSMVFDPTDFAPPISYRDRQAGRRPDSPLGEARPYSPSVRAHTPLAGSYDDLAPMPSPHLLRKSGTFTALDFAPPPRFRDAGGNASDAGSIRSNRSGMSAAGRMAVRTGAYRVSRIQKDVVGTKDDLMAALRPQLDMGRPY